MTYATLQTASGQHRFFVILANSFFARLRGLMFLPHFPIVQLQDQTSGIHTGLLLIECNSIHTCFMNFAIDVLFLDKKGCVIRTVSHIQSWRVLNDRSAIHVLELEAGTIAACNIAPGDCIQHAYFQVAKTCARGLDTVYSSSQAKSYSRAAPQRGQRGATMLEFAIAAPIITLCGLAILQYALLFFAKNQMHHASFMAARAGSMKNADLQAITDAYIEALIPLYGGGRNNQELAHSLAKAKIDTLGDANNPPVLTIERLNPTKESFDDWNDANLQKKPGLKEGRVIPFASQAFKDAGNIKAHSGQNIFDANILKIRVVHGFKPQIPLMKTLYTIFLKWLDPGKDPFQTHLIQSGRIPIINSVSIHMQSNAIESGHFKSDPGMGNNGKPNESNASNQNSTHMPSPIQCITLSCAPVHNSAHPPKAEPDQYNSVSESCIGDHCPVCRK